MDATEKQLLRAQLIASGAIRYWRWDKAKSELDRWLEIIAEELALVKEAGAVSKIRENLLTYGLRVPELRPVHQDPSVAAQTPEVTDDNSGGEVCSRVTNADTTRSTVHRGALGDLPTCRDSASHESRRVIETTEVKALPEHERVDDFGLPTGLCRTCRKMRLRRAAHLANVDTDKAEQNTRDSVDGSAGGFEKGRTTARRSTTQKSDKGSTGSLSWRNCSYNRVPPAIEQAVHQKFTQGWSKSRLAREFKLNRRTVIRICRDCDRKALSP
jgi:hypothetical protein